MVEARGVTIWRIISYVLIAVVALDTLLVVVLWRAALRREDRERFRRTVCR